VTKHMGSILVWAPRILGIAIALFLSLFAFDVFGGGYGFWKTALAFLIHLGPVLALALSLVLAWRWPSVGALVFIAAGTFYLPMAKGHIERVLLISGPLFVVGGLFLLQRVFAAPRRIQ
jgi:hypothetical protein